MTTRSREDLEEEVKALRISLAETRNTDPSAEKRVAELEAHLDGMERETLTPLTTLYASLSVFWRAYATVPRLGTFLLFLWLSIIIAFPGPVDMAQGTPPDPAGWTRTTSLLIEVAALVAVVDVINVIRFYDFSPRAFFRNHWGIGRFFAIMAIITTLGAAWDALNHGGSAYPLRVAMTIAAAVPLSVGAFFLAVLGMASNLVTPGSFLRYASDILDGPRGGTRPARAKAAHAIIGAKELMEKRSQLFPVSALPPADTSQVFDLLAAEVCWATSPASVATARKRVTLATTADSRSPASIVEVLRQVKEGSPLPPAIQTAVTAGTDTLGSANIAASRKKALIATLLSIAFAVATAAVLHAFGLT